jgi:branched-chain amino acid aminotransferase
MPAVAFVDGEIVPLAEARVPVTDRGFLWGDHAFEIVRAADGRPCDGDAHLARLAASAALLRMPPVDRDACARALARTLAAAGLADAAARVIVTRGEAHGLAPRADARARLVIVVEPLAPPASEPPGVRLHSLAGHRGGLVPAAAKSGNYLASVLALAAAADAGADDALLHDGDVVLETATASLLVAIAGAIVRPVGPLLPGITADRVAALLAARGHEVRVGVVTRGQLAAADELLVTSARRGVVPVIAVDGAAREPGSIAAEARDAYAAWIEDVRRGAGL